MMKFIYRQCNLAYASKYGKWHYYACTGRLLHCQVEHHVQDNFATPILYDIDNFKIYDIFSTYT